MTTSDLRYGHILTARSMRELLPEEIFEWFPWLQARPQRARPRSW